MPDNLSGTTPVGTPSSMDVFNAANQAISFKEQLPDLAQKLREALTSKFTTANPLYAQRESAQQEFLNAPSKARADISQMQQTSGIPLSPTQQESITSGRRSAAFAAASKALTPPPIIFSKPPKAPPSMRLADERGAKAAERLPDVDRKSVV